MSCRGKVTMLKPGSVRAFALLSALALTVAAAADASSVQGTPQTPQASRSPCEALTKKEVEEVLGAKVSDPIRRGDACHFEPAGPQARGIVVTVFWTHGERHMEAANMTERMVRNSGILYKEFGHSNDDVKDLGDDASFSLKTLYVLKGDAYFEIDAEQCSRKQAIALARKALARM